LLLGVGEEIECSLVALVPPYRVQLQINLHALSSQEGGSKMLLGLALDFF
jgi:hypothetical protein